MFAIICTYSKILRFLSRFQERISHWNGSSKYLYLPEGKTGSYISKLLERHKIAQSNLLLLRCHDRKFVRETSFVAGWKQKDKRAGMNCPMANVLATDSPVVSPPLHFFVFRPTNRIIREMIQISRYLLLQSFVMNFSTWLHRLTRDHLGIYFEQETLKVAVEASVGRFINFDVVENICSRLKMKSNFSK